MGNKISCAKKKDKTFKELNMAARVKLVEDRVNGFTTNGDFCAEDCSDAVLRKETVERAKLAFQNRTLSCLSDTDHRAMDIDPKQYDFDFENLVLEGGGNKGLAYCGAIKYLQEVGIMRKIKRIAGASAGAMTAALVAVGYSPDEIEDFLGNNISDVFIDHTCGYCSLIPNLLSGYGWNPGKKIFKWFGEKMKNKTGNEDITFDDIYQMTGMELCVIVTNLSQMSTEYCHPKTTPDMPVRLAVRMSMAIPGMFTAMRYAANGHTDVYVDGGVLCNYPIHCFDGWYLSMKPGDSFMERLQPLSELPRLFDKAERFGKHNPKTLGFLLFADSERDVLRYNLEKRVGVLDPPRPSEVTKLYKEKTEKKKLQDKLAVEHGRVVRAVNDFLQVLKRHNLDSNDTINRQELEAAFKDEQLSKDQIILLFGEDMDSHSAFEMLDKDKSGCIKFNELVYFIESTGICFQARFLGYQRKEVKNFISFLDSLQSTLLTNVKKIYVDDEDMARTVGINTGHVGTSDFKCEEADREFVVQRGYNATMSFLKYHVANNNLPKNSEATVKENSPPLDTVEEEAVDNASGERKRLI